MSRRVRSSHWAVHHYLLVLALVVVLVGAAASAYVRISSVNDAEDAIERVAPFTAELAAAEIQKAVDQLAATTSGLAATPNLGSAVADPQDCSLTFSGVGVFPRGHLDVIAPDGTVACSSALTQVGGEVDYGSESWFADAQADVVLEAPIADASGRAVLVHAVPTQDGVVVAGFLELGALGPQLSEQLGGPRRFEFLVVDAAGDRVVSRSIDAPEWAGAELTAGSWPRQKKTFERADLDGVDRIYGLAAVPDLGWSVYAGADRNDVVAPALELSWKTTTIVALGVVMTLGALWVVWRQIARPIRSLRRVVRGAAQDPSHASVIVSGPLEVRELGADFDALLTAVTNELGSRRRAEDRLAESEQTYRLLFEMNPEPMWIYDVETLSFLAVNDTACDQYGYSKPQWADMTVKDIRPREDVPALLDSVATHDRLDRSGPWRHLKANGDEIEVEITSHEIDFGGRRGRFVMAHDVTQRLQLEKQLRQSQRLESLGELAGGVAHDFNNLLAVIQNYSTFVREALVDGTSGNPELGAAVEDVDQISGAAARAASLTRRLLTFARQEVMRPEVVDPNAIVEEVRKLLARTIGEEIEFKMGLEEDLWPVLIDPSEFQQVILNLAINARDAMPEGGTLTIESLNVDVDETYASSWPGLRTGRFVRIRVTDTGIGMTPDVAERVFEPFFTTKEVGRGTGLGLATVHGIVAQAGGSIHVYSEPGMGTAMSALLPATDEAASDEARNPVRTLSGHESILVVEDEPAIREVMRRMLTRHGYEVMVAETGEAAISLAEDLSRRVDVVITDVVMPGMMGREITERIAAMRPDTKLIYMSGYAQAVLDSRGRLEEGRVLVEKPFTETSLLTAIREALDA